MISPIIVEIATTPSVIEICRFLGVAPSICPQAIDCNKSPEIDPPIQITAEIKITTAIPPLPVAPKPNIIKLTRRRTATVTPEMGQFEDPTKPVKYPARALTKKANKIVSIAINKDSSIEMESQM